MKITEQQLELINPGLFTAIMQFYYHRSREDEHVLLGFIWHPQLSWHFAESIFLNLYERSITFTV